MSTLLQKPAQTMSAGRIVGAAVLAFATLGMLALVWWSLSPILGRVYAGIRLAETLTLWRFTGWGRYFTTMPVGEPFAFVSVYKSSVGFGLVATLLTALLGYLAWRRRSRDHIDVVNIATAADFAHKAILSTFASKDRLVTPLAKEAEESKPPPLPVANPFKALRDLRDTRAVESVADSVPWPLTAALFLTIDAAVPLQDRKARDAALKAARTAADRHGADPASELPADLLSTLRTNLIWSIVDQAGRDIQALDLVHKILAGGDDPKANLDDLKTVVAKLAEFALSQERLFFPDYAWLRHVDPNLQARITAYG